MSELKLSVPERAILLILMAENDELSNVEIGEKYAPSLKLTGKSRLKLTEHKLVESRRVGQTFAFTLAEDGWRWCREELTSEPAPTSGSPGRALHAVLAGVDRYLVRTGRSLAHLFGGLPETGLTLPEPASQQPVEPQVAPAAPQAPAPAADDLERRIRQAYRAAARPAGSWVGLADLREQLGDLPRSHVDGVLRLMSRFPDVRIEEETNQKALTERDRAAVVRIGDRDQHVLAIGAS